MIENQELYCHNCDRYVQFRLDTELDGKHIITCPNCGHKHYRYINNGKISDRRWRSSSINTNPQPTYQTPTLSSSSTSVTFSNTNNSSSTFIWTFQTYGNSGS